VVEVEVVVDIKGMVVVEMPEQVEVVDSEEHQEVVVVSPPEVDTDLQVDMVDTLEEEVVVVVSRLLKVLPELVGGRLHPERPRFVVHYTPFAFRPEYTPDCL